MSIEPRHKSTSDVLDQAGSQALLEHAIEHAGRLGRPICVAVTDERGALLAFTRMDGAPVRSVKLSEAKAYSASRIEASTTAFHQRLTEGGMPASYFADPALTGLPGGAVVRSRSGATIGGVGISGLSPAEDQEVADASAATYGDRRD